MFTFSWLVFGGSYDDEWMSDKSPSMQFGNMFRSSKYVREEKAHSGRSTVPQIYSNHFETYQNTNLIKIWGNASKLSKLLIYQIKFGLWNGLFRLGTLYYNATLEAQQPPEEQRWTRSDYALERFLAVAVSENFGEEGVREIYHNFFGRPPFF